ncbi:MAG: methionyl-tRNA formyltransferase [Clostridiales bacterium]|nr:methionyl-tRNA formyltransferase [Clostridiales bacterium]
MGTPDFAVPCLDMLYSEGFDIAAVITRADKPKGRGGILTAPPVKLRALELGLMVLQPEKVRTKEFEALVSSFSPDLIITVAYGKILPLSILCIPKSGCINVHASLLPAYRGAAPINHAIINGDNKTGITTMFMDEGMDTGDILIQEDIEIGEEMDAGQLHDALAAMGSSVLRHTLERLEAGTLCRLPQDHSRATSAPPLHRDSGLVDWVKPARAIHNLIRGTRPWPAAYTYHSGIRMKIWQSSEDMGTVLMSARPTSVPASASVPAPASASASASASVSASALAPAPSDMDTTIPADMRTVPMSAASAADSATPGTILATSPAGLLVVTGGSGAILLKEIQYESGKRLKLNDCWHNFKIGDLLTGGVTVE